MLWVGIHEPNLIFCLTHQHDSEYARDPWSIFCMSPGLYSIPSCYQLELVSMPLTCCMYIRTLQYIALHYITLHNRYNINIYIYIHIYTPMLCIYIYIRIYIYAYMIVIYKYNSDIYIYIIL